MAEHEWAALEWAEADGVSPADTDWRRILENMVRRQTQYGICVRVQVAVSKPSSDLSEFWTCADTRVFLKPFLSSNFARWRTREIPSCEI